MDRDELARDVMAQTAEAGFDLVELMDTINALIMATALSHTNEEMLRSIDEYDNMDEVVERVNEQPVTQSVNGLVQELVDGGPGMAAVALLTLAHRVVQVCEILATKYERETGLPITVDEAVGAVIQIDNEKGAAAHLRSIQSNPNPNDKE